MPRHPYNLKQQLEAWSKREFIDGKHFFYFYDWFCKDSSIERKSRSLMPKVKLFAKLKNIDLEKTYVFFKNNCPVGGSLYDDFRICDLETGNVIYTVTPKNGHKSKKNQAEIWGQENDFNEPLAIAKNWTELLETL